MNHRVKYSRQWSSRSKATEQKHKHQTGYSTY